MSSAERNPVEELAEEFAERHRRGERPSIDEYTARYPQWADEIRDLFPALLFMEKLKPAASDLTGPFADDVTQPVLVVQPQRLGEFRLVREIGRGGMGVVYEAVQESLGRCVALKVLPGGALVSATYLERFRREARAAAKLQHPNIVPVHGTFETDGVHYYAMQYIEGQGLDQVLNDLRRLRERKGNEGHTVSTASAAHSLLSGNLTLVDSGSNNPAPRPPGTLSSHTLAASQLLPAAYNNGVARIGLQVAEALAYAHQQGVLHRDIKPSNLMLDARGTVWVTDFGLAKADDNGELTGTGDIVGTLRFMAPERFDGVSLPQSDLYSLGLTLYELLALRPAFDDANKGRLIDKVLHETPLSLRHLDRHIPRDLETIVLKCIARDPGDRYRSAQELAGDLRRFLTDEPIAARRIGGVERGWRWCRRNPAVAGLSLAVFVLVTVLVFQLIGKRPRLPLPGSSPDLAIRDPGVLTGFRHQAGESLYFRVKGRGSVAPIWGTDVYTDDSPLAIAVVHAGILPDGEEAVVKVTLLPGRDRYAGSERHDITSLPYGRFDGSYSIEKLGSPVTQGKKLRRPPPGVAVLDDPGIMALVRGKEGETLYFDVKGQDGGNVWGTEIYTDDSALPTAAVHAGLLKPGERGLLKVTFLPGRERYKGSLRNGIASQPYSAWQGSYRIELVTEQP